MCNYVCTAPTTARDVVIRLASRFEKLSRRETIFCGHRAGDYYTTTIHKYIESFYIVAHLENLITIIIFVPHLMG